MKLSYIYSFGNKGNTFVAQDISTESLPHQANTNNIHQYLTPDYFLPSSSNAQYYSRKYRGILNLNFQSRIKQVATVSLIFLSMVTGEVFAGDKRPKSKASSGRKQEVTFESIALSNNLPDVVPTLPLPDLIPSNPPVTPPPPPPPPPMPDIVPPVILPDVVPNPAAPPPMPDLLGDSGSSMPKQKTGFMAAMKQIAKGNFKLKKVKEEPKPKVVLSNEADLMSQILARREAIAGEQKSNKLKKAAKQVIVLNAEEEKAREAEISQKIAANKEKAATLRQQKAKEWEANRKKILAEVEVENQRRAAEAAKAIREQQAKENGSDSNAVIAGIDPVLHNNIVADLRHEISDLKEQLTLKSNDNSEGINSVESVHHIRSKRSLEGNRIVETKDKSTSTEDASLLEDRLFDDESLEDSSDRGSKNSSDTNYMLSKIVSQSNSIVSETVQDELADVEQELQSQKLKERESVEAVEDILSEDLITDTVEQAGINISSASPQEELARRANIIAKARDDLHFGSKAISKQIRRFCPNKCVNFSKVV